MSLYSPSVFHGRHLSGRHEREHRSWTGRTGATGRNGGQVVFEALTRADVVAYLATLKRE